MTHTRRLRNYLSGSLWSTTQIEVPLIQLFKVGGTFIRLEDCIVLLENCIGLNPGTEIISKDAAPGRGVEMDIDGIDDISIYSHTTSSRAAVSFDSQALSRAAPGPLAKTLQVEDVCELAERGG